MSDPLNDGSMDLPYESQDETPMDDEFAVCGGVVTFAATLPVGATHQPALVFRFALADGSGFLAPVLLCVNDDQLWTLTGHINRAAKDAIKAARRHRGERP